MINVLACASEAYASERTLSIPTDLSEDALEELESMSAIYPDNFAQVPGSRLCLLSAFSDDDTRGAIIRVTLGEEYPQAALAEIQMEAAIGVDEAAFVKAGEALCLAYGSEGEPALFELMVLLADAVNSPIKP